MGDIYHPEGWTLDRKFESLAHIAHATIIVATPDEISTLVVDGKGHEIPEEEAKKKSFSKQARKNIYLEFGWFWHYHGLATILVLCKGKINEIIPSDLHGLEGIPYEDATDDKVKGRLKTFVSKIKNIPRISS
jgi:predicted nucleotide-binding protein